MRDKINADLIVAMKAGEKDRVGTLRLVNAAIKSADIDARPSGKDKIDDAGILGVLTKMIKQRRDSIEQFVAGGRQELADKEAAEIRVIESYMPRAAGEEEMLATVRAVIAEMGSPTMKEMGAVMKNVMARFQASGTRADGKAVSEMVKRELTPKP